MTEGFNLHPGLMLLVTGLLLPLLRGSVRQLAIVALPSAALLVLWMLPEGRLWQLPWLDHTLAPLVVDKLSRLFATIFILMAAVGGLFALGQTSRLEVPAAFIYAGSAVGVALAGDLVSVFIYWELMAVGSTLVIWSAGTLRAPGPPAGAMWPSIWPVAWCCLPASPDTSRRPARWSLPRWRSIHGRTG
jgi:multicomponent Na+:H+ antiporter subunit D